MSDLPIFTMQKHKYRVVWISSKRFGGGNLCLYWDLTWGKHSFNYLGIDFDVDLSKTIIINFEKKNHWNKIFTIKQWSKRQLTPIGHIIVIKPLILQKLVHLFTIVHDFLYSFLLLLFLGPGWLNELGSWRARVAQWVR